MRVTRIPAPRNTPTASKLFILWKILVVFSWLFVCWVKNLSEKFNTSYIYLYLLFCLQSQLLKNVCFFFNHEILAQLKFYMKDCLTLRISVEIKFIIFFLKGKWMLFFTSMKHWNKFHDLVVISNRKGQLDDTFFH